MGVKPIASRPRQNRIMCEPCEYIFGCFGCNVLIQVVRWINTSKSRWNGHGISKTVFKVNACIQIQSLFLRVQLTISEHWPVAEEATSRYLNHRHDGVSNHRGIDGLLNRLFWRRSTKTSTFRATGLFEGNPPVTGGFPSQRTSNAENISIWWRLHGLVYWR